MKTNLWILVTIGLTIVVGSILLKDFAGKSDTKNQQELDRWIHKMLAKSLAEKLSKSATSIMQALENSGDIELIRDIKNIVRRIDLTFTRHSSSLSKIQVQLEADYSDGTFCSATIEKDWDELPQEIRKEFIQTGSPVIHHTEDLFTISTNAV